MLLVKALSVTLLCLQPCSASLGDKVWRRAVQQRENREIKIQEQSLHKRGNVSACDNPSCYRFYDSKTKPYFIEKWPDVPFETGEFYSGWVDSWDCTLHPPILNTV